jgi:predicted permease
MRVYGALLHLYPASFRAEYGEEMRRVFRRRLSAASGTLDRTGVWVAAFLDLLGNAVRVHGDLLRQDARYTARTLRRSPGFAVTAVLVSALGIGATAASFSITDRVLIRPLPFADSGRLVALWQNQRGYGRTELSPGNYRDWKREGTTLDAMAAYRNASMNLVGQGDPQRIEGASVTADLFPMLGREPLLGRAFTAADDRGGAPGTVLLSHGLWQGRFAGDPGVLGRKVTLDGEPYLVIGVMPRDFYFPTRDALLWTPIRFVERDFEDRTDTYLHAVGKLKRGVSLEKARAQMRLVAARLERAYPKQNAKTSATVNRLRDEISEQSRLLLTALFGASLGVLLIACTNLANLLLARALARRRELSVRSAMGAGRDRLVRQLLTESLILAACGGLLGMLVAVAAAPVLTFLIPTSFPIPAMGELDTRMLIFAALLTGVTGIGFGVLPALRACGDTDASALQETARTGAGRRTERLRSLLVVAEVTASVALLICSGLLLRALWRIQRVDPGFRAESVLTLRTALPLPKYEKTERRVQFYTSVLSRVGELPGVSSAAYISFLPMVARGGIWPVGTAGQPEDPAESRVASLRFVTPGFFSTLRVPLRRGRDVAESDTLTTPPVAVVSESLVRRMWPGENPLGRRFRFAMQDVTVVGVVGDIRVRGLERESEPQVYLSYRQVQDRSIIGYVPKDLVVRSSLPPGALVPAIRRIIAKVDPDQPISDVRRLEEIVEAETTPRRVQARVLGGFAAIALLLAGIGIHGLLAFTVSQRSREIGVRLALGAQSRDILKIVLRHSVLLAAAGSAAGVAIALAAGRAMQALLAGVSPADPAALLAAVVLSFGMTLAGSLLPALRATRVDPATVIRAE